MISFEEEEERGEYKEEVAMPRKERQFPAWETFLKNEIEMIGLWSKKAANVTDVVRIAPAWANLEKVAKFQGIKSSLPPLFPLSALLPYLPILS